MVLSDFYSRGAGVCSLFLFLLLLKFPASAQNEIYSPELAVVDADIQHFMDKWQIPGATAALVKDDKLLYSKGFGIADAGKPMQQDALFRIASLSKPITAMAIMKLVQDDILCIDDPVFGPGGVLNNSKFSKYSDPRLEQITVQHLLEHSAGWDRAVSPERDPMFSSVRIARAMQVPAPADAVSVIQYMLLQPLDFTPGTRFAYSNLGYNILGRIIEEVTHTSYEAYVRQAILQPIGITNMFLGKNLYHDKYRKEVRYFDLKERLANAITGKNNMVPYIYGGFNLEAMDAHGGWVASASELAKLLLAMDSASINSPLDVAHRALMLTPSEVFSGYAKGWFVSRQGSFWHTGALVGTASLMASVSNGMKWVLLFNARPEKPAFYPELDRLMWNAVSKIETWPTHNLWQPEETELVALQ